MHISSPLPTAHQDDASRWHSLRFYNGYRVFIAFLMMAASHLFGLSGGGNATFNTIALVYFGFSIVCVISTWLEKPSLDISLPIQIILDICFIVLMAHYQQDARGSISLFLVITVASAALVSNGRLAIFYAAMATICVLLEQTYNLSSFSQNYTNGVLLSLSCFAVAWLAYSLAKRAQQSEQLASQRGLDVQNLAQINALITREMQDGVLVVNQSKQIQYFNTQAETLLEVAGLQNQSLSTLSPEIFGALTRWEIGGNSTSDSSDAIVRTGGSGRELKLRFLASGETRLQGAIIFMEDWSQLQTRAMQTKLAALGRLTANIAHEIRNPLSAISHANQLLQEDEAASDPTKRLLQIIADNVLRVDQIIKDVLELNRRDRTNQELIALNSFMQDFYHQFCAIEKIPEAAFLLEIETADVQVLFDRRHLNQILWNLCKNGWRHSQQLQSSLKLVISTASKQHNLRIAIYDDGGGVSEAVRAHLFEPFFTTEKSGTGLGLYIARELAEANGAKLAYHSSERGSQFFIEMKKA